MGIWSVPERLRTLLPSDAGYMRTWPAVRHVWHVTEYERCLAIRRQEHILEQIALAQVCPLPEP